MLLRLCWGCCGNSPILPWEAADSTLSGLGWNCPLENNFSHTEMSRSWLLICIKLFFLPLFPLSEPFPSLSWAGEGCHHGEGVRHSTTLEMSSFLPVLLCVRSCWSSLAPAGHSHCCPRAGGRGLALMMFPHFPIWLRTGSDRAVTELLPELSQAARRIFPPLS